MTHVQHARRQTCLRRKFREQQRAERGEFCRLQHHGIACGKRRRNLPCQHQQREIPRDDLPDHADRHLIGELALLQLGPAGVVQEMPRGKRHVEIAGLPDRLAVVDRFQHRKQPGMTLQHARQRVEVTRAAVTAELYPKRLRGARGAHGRLDIGGRALRDPGQRLAGGRLDRREVLAGMRRDEFAANEMSERSAVPL